MDWHDVNTAVQNTQDCITSLRATTQYKLADALGRKLEKFNQGVQENLIQRGFDGQSAHWDRTWGNVAQSGSTYHKKCLPHQKKTPVGGQTHPVMQKFTTCHTNPKSSKSSRLTLEECALDTFGTITTSPAYSKFECFKLTADLESRPLAEMVEHYQNGTVLRNGERHATAGFFTRSGEVKPPRPLTSKYALAGRKTHV